MADSGKPQGETDMFKKILVPVDLSDPEHYRDAIETAASFARQFGSTVRLVTVLPVLPSVVADYIPMDTQNKMLDDASGKLRAIVEKLSLGEGNGEVAVREGAVYPAGLEEASVCNADLIVMGSHRPAMATYLLGSNAARIVRHAPCSVMVLRGED